MQKIINAAFIALLILLLVGAKPVTASSFPHNFLEDEAGVAAFFSFAGPTNLKSNLLQNLFRTISIETDSYLVGFIPVEGLESGNDQDVKVFIHNNGWVVAYYTKESATSKIFKQEHATNRLVRTLERVAEAIEVTPEILYHHFQFPEAEHLRIAKLVTGSATKTIDFRLPPENAYFERSWYLSAWGLFYSGRLNLDGKELAYVHSGLAYDRIPADSMVTISKHVLQLIGGLAGAECYLAILYAGDMPIIVNYADELRMYDFSPVPPELEISSADVPFYLKTYLPIQMR